MGENAINDFLHRWQYATSEEIAQVRRLLQDLLVAVRARKLEGGIDKRMILHSFRDEDLLDYVAHLVDKDGYWGGLPESVQPAARKHREILRGLVESCRRPDGK